LHGTGGAIEVGMTTVAIELLARITGGQSAQDPNPAKFTTADLKAACEAGRANPLPGLTPEESCYANIWDRGVGAGTAQQDGRWMSVLNRALPKSD
jgi:hypothetical protein